MNMDLAWVRYKVGVFFSKIKTGGRKMRGRKREIYLVSISNRRCDCGVFRYIDYVVSGSGDCHSVSGALTSI